MSDKTFVGSHTTLHVASDCQARVNGPAYPVADGAPYFSIRLGPDNGMSHFGLYGTREDLNALAIELLKAVSAATALLEATVTEEP